jgi:hypothetical protein
MFKTFRDKFIHMVDTLRSDASIVVVAAEIVPPEPGAVAEAERGLGYSLGPSLTEFYTACDGVKLVWTPVEYEEDGIWEGADARREFADPSKLGPWLFKSGDLVGGPKGCIWIPSCKQIFGKVDQFDDLLSDQDAVFEEYREALGEPGGVERIAPFDYASSFYDFAFLLNGKPDPKLVRGEDNGACFDDSRLLSLAEYLEVLTASMGSVEARVEAFALPDGEDEDEEEDEE